MPGEGNGTPLQYSCLENPMDRGAWKAAVHGVAEGRTRLSDFTFTFHFHALVAAHVAHPFPGERNLGRNSSPFLLPQPLLSEVVLLLQDQCFRLNIHFCPSSSRHLTHKVKYYACKSVLALGGLTETSRALCCVPWAHSPLHSMAGTQKGG